MNEYMMEPSQKVVELVEKFGLEEKLDTISTNLYTEKDLPSPKRFADHGKTAVRKLEDIWDELAEIVKESAKKRFAGAIHRTSVHSLVSDNSEECSFSYNEGNKTVVVLGDSDSIAHLKRKHETDRIDMILDYGLEFEFAFEKIRDKSREMLSFFSSTIADNYCTSDSITLNEVDSLEDFAKYFDTKFSRITYYLEGHCMNSLEYTSDEYNKIMGYLDKARKNAYASEHNIKVSEIEIHKKYHEAIELENTAKTEMDYWKAELSFRRLGNHLDSAQKADECSKKADEQIMPDIKEYEQNSEKILQKRQQYIDEETPKLIKAYEEKLQTLNAELEELREKNDSKIKLISQEKAKCEEELSNTFFLAFIKKSRYKKQIVNLTNELGEAETEKKQFEKKYSDAIAFSKSSLETDTRYIKNQASNKFKLPIDPRSKKSQIKL